MMFKLIVVDKSMVFGRLSGLLIYFNFVYVVLGVMVSINRFRNFVYSILIVCNVCMFSKILIVVLGSF